MKRKRRFYESVLCYADTPRGQCGQHATGEIQSCSCGFKGPVCPEHRKEHFYPHKDWHAR